MTGEKGILAFMSDRDYAIKYALWLNLLLGFYNIYLYTHGGWWFNIIVGTLNIGAWVFNRGDAFKKWNS